MKCEHKNLTPIEIKFPDYIIGICKKCENKIKFEELSITSYNENINLNNITIEEIKIRKKEV